MKLLTMFLTNLLIFAIAIASPAFAHHGGDVEFRITNGILLNDPKGLPFVLSLEKDNKFLCGAVLVSPGYALTTALCMKNLSPESLTVRAGTFLREDKRGKHMQVRLVKNIIKHPKFQANGFHDFDAALLVLNKIFDITDFVRPINLASRDFTQRKALIMGWGKNEIYSDNDNLMVAPVTLISNEECQKEYKDTIEKITDTMACAKSSNDQVVCHDNGSPVIIHNPADPSMDVLVGLAAHTGVIKDLSHGEMCDTKKPSMLTRISSIKDWVASIAL